MTMNLTAGETPVTAHRPIDAGLSFLAKLLSFPLVVLLWIGREVLEMLRQDIANGKIYREPEDWER